MVWSVFRGVQANVLGECLKNQGVNNSSADIDRTRIPKTKRPGTRFFFARNYLDLILTRFLYVFRRSETPFLPQ